MTQATTAARYGAPRGETIYAAPERPPYGLAALAGVVIFVLYAATLAPTTAFWDTSEYIATAHILGVPHPPGNPLFVLLARAWDLILSPTGLATAIRVNLFSALMGAATATCWYLVVHRILCFFTESEAVRRIGAGAAVLLSATAFTVWHQSNVNEKVYTVSLFTIALLSWIAFLWRDHVELHRTDRTSRFHDDNALVFIAFVLALSVGNHLMAFLAAPAIFVLLLLVKPQVLANWKLYLWSIVFAVVGLSVHLFLPIRAGLNPVINEANPTCDSMGSAFTSILTFGKAGCANLSAALARTQYAKPPVTDRLAPFWAQILNYFQYFDWQWARSIQGVHGYFAPLRLLVTFLFVALGIYGAYRHFQRDRKSFWYVLTLFLTLSVALVFYLNFKYGFGQAQALGLPMDVGEVRERDYFFLVSFSIWGLWAGIGITALWLGIAEQAGGLAKKHLWRGAPVLLLAFVPLVANWSYASRAGVYAARDWAYNLLMSVEPYGVLFTNGDNDTFPLWYAQEVEGIRKDVTVIVWSYLNTPWYAKQIRELTTPCPTPGDAAKEPTRNLCQRVFRPVPGVTVYDSAAARYPTKTILPLADAQIDHITSDIGYIQLSQPQTYAVRGIEVPFRAGTFLPAADQFILTIIQQAWGDRPIYFASTTNAHRKLGLDRYAAR
ncbi:MAG TPA: DUF2723 domain-containing protein, partial [Longimicrobiaceae bacterium]|nr:DUF2723 domain-containing protein [Longimicrobiaceae bacterium]